MRKIKNKRKELVKELDKVFSEYIRRRWADHSGIVNCVTCGAFHHWKSVDAGHYISRRYMSTRWDDKNLAPQCKGCNIFGRGRHDDYAVWLVKYYGEGILQELAKKKKTITKYKISDLEELIDMYKGKIDNLG